jgi:hypothetical protein
MFRLPSPHSKRNYQTPFHKKHTHTHTHTITLPLSLSKKAKHIQRHHEGLREAGKEAGDRDRREGVGTCMDLGCGEMDRTGRCGSDWEDASDGSPEGDVKIEEGMGCERERGIDDGGSEGADADVAVKEWEFVGERGMRAF